MKFVAEAITVLGSRLVNGFQTYHVPHDDGIGLDEFVDWLIAAGYPIQRVDDFSEWFQRFKRSFRDLPDRQRQASVLQLLRFADDSNDGTPFMPTRGSFAPVDRFRAAVQEARIGANGDIPHISPAAIITYVTDLKFLGLLD